MKKFFIILSCIFFPVAGYFGYTWWHSRQKADAFQLIPESAVAVIETTELYNNWEKLRDSYFWKNLQTIPFAGHIYEAMGFADSVSGGQEKLKAFFHGRKIISSLHVISNHQADYVFYIPVENSADREMVGRITGSMKDWKAAERLYGGITIEEFTRTGERTSFSLIRYRNLLIGSHTAFLIEDIIRIINAETAGNFLKGNPEVISSAHAHSDTYVYIDYRKISSFVSLLANVQSHAFLKSLDYFAGHSVLDYRMSAQEILFDGFTYSKKDTHFVEVFAGQKPQKFNMKSYIPLNTGTLYYFGFDDPEKLNESLTRFWRKYDPSLADRRARMNDQSGIDINELYTVFGSEAALCFVNSSNSIKQGKLLFIESGDAERFFTKLNKFVTIMKDGRRDTLLYEKQGSHLIREMNIPEFPSLLLGDLCNDFDRCYYTRINNYIVFADDVQHLRELILNIDSENVWGKSPQMSAFLENHFSASNISLVISTPQAWKHLLNSVAPEIKKTMQESPDVLKKIGPVLFQFNRFQDKIYTNIVFNHGLNKELRKDKFNYNKVAEFRVTRGISALPYFDFSGKTAEFLLQDSANVLYMSNGTRILWQDSIAEPVAGSAVSADLDKNGTKDLVFAAGNKIYSYNASGKLLPYFPIILADTVSLAGISLADYEGDGKFRILANDVRGNVYMFDVKGKNLEGWRPRTLGSLSAPVCHIRVKGKDYFVAVQKDGKLNVLNRRGEMYKGFPLDLGKSCLSPLYFEIARTPDKTFIYMLSTEGTLIKLNLQASLIEKRSLSNAAISKCMLLSDHKQESFIVSVQAGDQLMILNQSGEEVFQTGVSANNIDISYGRMKDMYSLNIYSKESNTSVFFLFDDQWKEIFKSPDFQGRILSGRPGSDILLFKFSNNKAEMGNIKPVQSENPK